MSRALLALMALLFALSLSGCAELAAGSGAGRDDADGGRQAVAAAPTPEPTKPPLRVEDLVGEDGRLTLLVLGSDSRDGVVGTRTDAIIVASINPRSGRVVLVSLPRDTVNVPIAPGDAYSGRINSLFWEYERSTGKRKVALSKFKRDLSYAFGIELDYYALVEFDGLIRLINSIGGVDVRLKEALIDPTMHVGKSGLKLRAGPRQLDGKTALAFARSRHADTDYDRSRRQHQLLTAAAEKVRRRGADQLPSLVDVARKKLETDVPMRAAPALLALVTAADLDKVRSVVLEPGRYARELIGTYTITPKVLEQQKLFDRLMKPVE
jgi:polyisoprenyl-teichoic acid--peptidoglycan teichoic acid transferase